ncbi:MAG: alanine dehydrogenase [bacterium]
MRIGIPKETLLEEKRVALAPAGVDLLVKSGHTVFIESNAGAESHFTDEEYRKVGANVVYNTDEVYQRSELIAKVAPLVEKEAELLQEDQILFSFLRLTASRKKIIDTLISKRITAIGYELIEKEDQLPVLQSMSEIAGQLSIQFAERFLCSDLPNTRGILLGGITGIAPAAVVIVGAGVVGYNAARAALGRGAHVIILDNDLRKLRNIENLLSKNITTVVSNPYTLARGVKYADVLIIAIQVKGEKAPIIISEEMVKTMKKGAVIIDVSIDQGGSVETARPTTLSNPTYIMHNVVHYCVPNMPASVARTASYGLTNATIDYIKKIADNGLTNSLINDAGLSHGVCIFNGGCTNELVAGTFNLEFRRLHLFSTN